MASFQEAVGDATRAAVCTLAASDPNVVALLERTGLENNPLANAGRAFRLAFCSNDEPIGDNGLFTNGQCPLGYQVFSGTDYDGTTTNPTPFRSETQPGNVNQGPFTGIEEGTPTATARRFFYIRPGLPSFTLNAYNILNSGINPRPYVVLTPVAGNPDNCGSPPAIIPAPSDLPLVSPITINYTNNNNVDRSIDGTLRVFAPVFSPVFAPRIPVRFSLGGVDLNGNLNLDGELELDFDFPTGGGDDKDTPEPPEGDPPDEDTVIIGARVSVVSDTGQTTTILFNNDRPDLYLPRAGVLQFLQPAGDESAWSADIPIKTSPQWVPCGSPGYATRIAFTATPGVVLSVTAVLGRPPKE